MNATFSETVINYDAVIQDPVIYIQLLALFVYTVVVYTLWTSKRVVFKAGFYRIFAFNGINDIIWGSSVVWSRSSRMLGLCREFEYVYRVEIYFTGACYMFHIGANTLISVNRITSVFFTNYHMRFWKLKKFWPFLAVLAIFSFAAYTPTLFVGCTYKIEGTHCYRSGRVEKLQMVYDISMVAIGLFCIELILSSTATYYQYKKKKEESVWNKALQSAISETGIALAVTIQLIPFAFEIVYDTLQIFEWYQLADNWFFGFLSNYVKIQMIKTKFQFAEYTFFLTICNCLLILFASPSLRKDITERIIRLARTIVKLITCLQPTSESQITMVTLAPQ